jgi:hypothetical protein
METKQAHLTNEEFPPKGESLFLGYLNFEAQGKHLEI